MLVQIKVKTEKGKYLLREIHPTLKEGDIILVHKYTTSNGCIDFKWNGTDACLWLNENCEVARTRKKPINLK